MQPEPHNVPPPVSEATSLPAQTDISTPAPVQAEVPTPTAAWPSAAADILGLPPLPPPFSTRPASFRFGPYQVLGEIAHGGMGVVYRARHIFLGREVALKTIHGIHQVKPEFVSRFYQEAQAVAQLKHPHIVQVFDFGMIDGQHYYTMGLALDGSLLNNLDRYQQDPRAAVVLLEKVARAVQHIHEHGLLHRDLKPGNILLDDGEPLVSDFGLAKSLELDLELTRTGSAVGTPSYMAPEQAAGRGHLVCPQTDTWALGVILYELVCGRKPFTGNSREEVVRAIREDETPAPRSVQKSLDRNLEAILLRCLEKTPSRRYVSAGALADDLGAWLRGEPTRARPAGWARRCWRGVRRHRVALAAAALVVGVLATLYLRDPQRDLEGLQKELAAKDAVTLIGSTGMPKWSSCIVGHDKTKFALNPDGTFNVHTDSLCLLELLPDPRHESYRLHARVKHQPPGGSEGEAGIYVGRRAFAGAEKELNLFFQMSFNDQWASLDTSPFVAPPLNAMQKKRVHKNAVRWEARLHGGYTQEKEKWLWNVRMGTRGDPPLHYPDGAAAGWRELVIVVTPEKIQGTWDGQPLPEVPIAVLEADMGRTLAKSQKRRPDDASIGRVVPKFVPRGGLGLYVFFGSASFCDVSITPLNGAGAL